VSCGATACGSFNPATTTNDEPTTYTAPAAIPSGNTVTIAATSVTDSTKSASHTIAITPTGPRWPTVPMSSRSPGREATLLPAFLLRKTAPSPAASRIRSTTTSRIDLPAIQHGQLRHHARRNLEITIQLVPNDPSDIEILSGTLASGQKGFISGIDGAVTSGTLDLQSSTTAPTGGYAFALDPSSFYDGSPWIDGIVNVDSAGGISGNGSVLDIDFEGGSRLNHRISAPARCPLLTPSAASCSS